MPLLARIIVPMSTVAAAADADAALKALDVCRGVVWVGNARREREGHRVPTVTSIFDFLLSDLLGQRPMRTSRDTRRRGKGEAEAEAKAGADADLEADAARYCIVWAWCYKMMKSAPSVDNVVASQLDSSPVVQRGVVLTGRWERREANLQTDALSALTIPHRKSGFQVF